VTETDIMSLARRVARKYDIDGMDYDDAVQEAWLAMWRAWQRRPDHPMLESWLKFKARKRLNSLARRYKEPAGWAIPEEVELDRPVPWSERPLPDVDLSCLSDRQRLAVELRHQQGLSVMDVAHWMDISPNAASCLLRTAYGKLKKFYDR
jgi:RNA polymerase sigma factor (sigma-70 family)